MKLFEKCAIVTGAATGIGEAYAHALAAHGARVVIADIDEKGATKVAADLEATGAQALAARADVTSEGDLARLVERWLTGGDPDADRLLIGGGFTSPGLVSGDS